MNEEAPGTNLDIIASIYIIIEVSGGCVFIQPLFYPLYCVKRFLNYPTLLSILAFLINTVPFHGGTVQAFQSIEGLEVIGKLK